MMKKNTVAKKRRLVIVCVIFFLSVSVWLVLDKKEPLKPASYDHEVAAAEDAANIQVENSYIVDSNKDSDCSTDPGATSILYNLRFLGANLHNTNFIQLELGSRIFELPNGDFEMTGYHKYLESLSLEALEGLAESGDKEAMVAMSDRSNKNWITEFTSPIAQIDTDNFSLENPDFVKALESIDLMIESSTYKKARDWAFKAAEFGKFIPLNYEIMPALDEHHTMLQIKYDFSQTEEEREHITAMMATLEEEYYRAWYIYQYTFEGFDEEADAERNFVTSYVPDHLSQEQLDRVQQESIEMMERLESTVRNNGAMMPRELYEQVPYITDPEQLIGVKAPSLYTQEEFINKIGSAEFAKYDDFSEEDVQHGVDCLQKIKNESTKGLL